MDNNLHTGDGNAEKNPVKAHRGACPKASVLKAAIVLFAITAIVMLMFEVTKQVLYPSITIWQSHLITICFTSIAVFLLSLAVLKSFRKKMIAEMEFRQAVEADRKQAEEALRDSENRFEKVFRSSPDGITMSELAGGRILEANDAILKLMEYQRSEVVGKTAPELNVWVHPEQRSALIDKINTQGAIRDEEVNLRTKSGKIREVELSGERIQIQGQWCLLLIARDVTEKKVLEEQLQQARKMDAIGHLAGGIAHDFNNLLGVILMSCELAFEKLKPEDPLREKITVIRETGQRAAGLTRQLLAYSRQQMLRPEVLDLNGTVIAIRQLLQHLIREDIELVNVLDPSLGNVKADRAQIEQVIMNLVVNARDAMPKGGKLTIETKSVRLDSSYPDPQCVQQPGPYVLLTVSDNGVGMDKKLQSHIFEPFFTTKDVGKGTGLGLATVYGIVKQSGGFIWVNSEPGKGTTFKIYFPQVDGAQPVRPVEIPQKPAAAAATTVMIVEDEEVLRQLTCESLRTSGVKVVEAETPEAAIRIIQRGAPIDVLLTDIVMPTMSGIELANRVRSMSPQIKVIYMSGYTHGVIAQHGVLEAGQGFLQKPFTSSEVLRKIHEVMDRPAAA